MYKRIAAATAVIILASIVVIFSSKMLPRIVQDDNPSKTVIFLHEK